MNEYRATTTTEEQPFVAHCAGELPAYMSLDAQYGLTDDDLAIGYTTTPEQTVEQELQAYITALLSQPTINILKFWEASREN
jgi:hypothetical protein